MSTHLAEIIIEDSPQKVFEALTEPDLVRLWQHGRFVTTDWSIDRARLGGYRAFALRLGCQIWCTSH
jgi:uncharacterized protein YndB with AHSA1/START domain